MSRARRGAALGVIVLGLVIAGGAAWLALRPADRRAPAIATPGAPAPQIALPVVGGGTSDLGADHGKIVLVNFWATWCEPCRVEMPGLQRLAHELPNQAFRMYSVDLQEDADQVQAFEQKFGLNLHVLLDQDGDVTRAYGVRALPATFVIDRDGILRLQRLGALANGDAETSWSQAWLADQVRSMLNSG